MITIFKKSNEVKQSRISVSSVLTKFMNEKLQQFAIYLSKKTQHIQPRRLAAALLTLCVVGSLALSVKLLHSLRQGSEVKFQSIRSPALKPSYSFSPGTGTLHRIKNLHRQLDSLKKNNYL